MTDTLVRGRAGEDLAVLLLESRGLTVIERNWHGGRAGELDVIARDRDGTIVVVEVKTRGPGAPCGGLESITPEKLARMKRLAAMWLEVEPHETGGAVRFDVIAVDVGRKPSEGARVEWTRGVAP